MSKIEDAMAKQQSKSQPGWADVKANLADFDRAALLGLVQDLYIARKDNRAFLHARFGLGEDALGPYKTIIDRWLWPDVLRRQDTSVSKAKQAILRRARSHVRAGAQNGTCSTCQRSRCSYRPTRKCAGY